MSFFWNLNKSANAADLAHQGLSGGNKTTRKEIKDCVFLVANALGEAWENLSQEAAAGVVLVALAKNSRLVNFINGEGWKLVLSLVRTNPGIASKLSRSALAEINTYRATHELCFENAL